MDQLTSTTAVQASDAPALKLGIQASPLKLCGEVTAARDMREEDILLSLMAGPVVLGTLRTHGLRSEAASPHLSFGVPDFGLSSFAEMTALEGLELSVDAGDERITQAPIKGGTRTFSPLGMRHGLGQTLRLVDIWLEGSRNLNLRFEGNSKGGKSVDVYQCLGAKLVAVASDQPVSGLTAIVRVPLINPFEPVLLIFKGEDRSIDAIDFVPFPSLARGGLHAAERVIAGFGADDVADTAALSMELVAAWMERRADASRCVNTIDFDPAIETGLEPALDRDLLGWMTRSLGIRLHAGPATPAFIAEFLGDQPKDSSALGHVLTLPADCAPTLGSLLRAFPDDAAPGRTAGSYGISDASRQGRIWSVWQPPLNLDLDALQLRGAPRIAPMLTVRNPGAGRPVSLRWPLALAFREPPTRIGHTGPFEIAADFDGPLLRTEPGGAPAKLAVIVLAGVATGDPVRLLDSLARQTDVEIGQVIICTFSDADQPELAPALVRMFPDVHSIVEVARTSGRIEQVAAAREALIFEKVVVADSATVAPDARILVTLAQLLDASSVGSAGCMLREASDKMPPISAGYCFSEVALRAVPQLSFTAIDPSIWRGPSTHPVVANSMSLMMVRRDLLATLPPTGSTSIRPESDDLLLGMHVVAQGGVNLCTTVVSAFTSASFRPSQAPISLPYRLDPAELARITEATTIVQRVA